MCSLKHDGIGIIYISHRLSEITAIADRAVALRDGKNSGELVKSGINHDNMVKLMIGREVAKYYRDEYYARDETVLELKNLVLGNKPDIKLSFSLKKGEVLGMFGLIGSGRTELMEALFGFTPVLTGDIILNSVKIKIRSITEAIKFGFGYVTEDRKINGLVLDMSLKQNMSLVKLMQLHKFGFWDRPVEHDIVTKLVSQLHIKSAGLNQSVKNLSGGNQQKVVLGKWLSINPMILVLDEPTRGVDVGAKHEIHNIITELARNGVSILMISSEMEEIIGMSDRVLVMHENEITGELTKHELTEQNIMSKATGKAVYHA
jgi:ribose transport system ATP-binding protein